MRVSSGRRQRRREQPFLTKRQDGKPFAFAGIWDEVKVKSGEIVDAANDPHDNSAGRCGQGA
jgi:putative SOS response-associated peptidase YedK